MASEYHSYRALIVSASAKFAAEIGSLLAAEHFRTDCSHNAAQARRMLLEDPYDFVLINAGLTDEFGSRLSIDSSSRSGTIAVLFVAADVYEQIVSKTAISGVFVIRKPVSRTVINQSLSLLISARERLRVAETTADRARSKLDELRLVNRAKWLLIENEHRTENDAHRLLEKSAMDAGITKRQAAQIIIEKYS